MAPALRTTEVGFKLESKSIAASNTQPPVELGLALTLFPEWSPELPSPIRAANKLLRRRPLWLRIERAVDGAADEFLQDKPEKMVVLYGGQGAMGYFRKLATTTPRNRPVRRDMLVA